MTSEYSKIRIRMDGDRRHTEIAVVTPDGTATPLGVTGVEFSAHSNPERTTLRLTACFGDVLELDIPMTGEAADKIKHIAKDPTSERLREVWGNAAEALREELARIGIDGIDEDALRGLVVAAQMRDVGP